MAWTTPKVEINFRTSLANADNWVDVTADVWGSVRIERGRQSELEEYSAGTCRFQLNNTIRRYDFANASSPYYTKLLPRTQVRVTAFFSSTTYNLFFGYIQGWPQSYDYVNNMALVDIQAIDSFDQLAQSRWSGGVATSYLTYLKPDFWFRSVYDNGVEDSTHEESMIRFIDSVDGKHTITCRTDAWGNASDGNPIQNDVAGKSVGRMLNVNGFAGIGYSTETSSLLNNTNTWSIGGWFRTRNAADQPQTSGVAGVFSLGGLIHAGGVAIDLIFVTALIGESFNKIRIRARHYSGTPSSAAMTLNTNIIDDQWHHIVVTNAPSDMRLYVDGALVGSTTVNGSVTLDDSNGLSVAATPDASAEWNGWFYDIFGFNRTLSSTEVGNLNAAGRNLPFQKSDERIQSLLTLYGSSIASDLATGDSILNAVNIDGGTLLDSLQEVVKAEGGFLYVNGAGTLVFRGRLDVLTMTRSTTLQATFDDTGANLRYMNAEPTLDVEFMYNQVVTSIENGPQYQINDLASQTAYGIRSLDRTGLILSNVNDAISQAQWDLVKYSTPKARLPIVSFSARASSATMTAALGLQMLDRIRVTRQPFNMGVGPWSFDTHIEGISMDINLAQLTFDVSYSVTQFGIVSGYLKLDSATEGIVGTAKLAG